MIIHIGGNTMLLEKDIVAMLDVDTVFKSKENIRLIEELIKDDCLVNSIDENIKTYIIATDSSERNKKIRNSKYKLYESNISSTSLLNRIYSRG